MHSIDPSLSCVPLSFRRVPAQWSALALAALLAVLPSTVAQAQVSASETPSRSSPANLTSGSLPGLGDGSEITIAEERRLGYSIAKQIYRDPDYFDDPVLVDYLQSVWRPLLVAARDRGDVPVELYERLAWELMIDRNKEVNAFALPGGYMGVNLGLLAVTESPQELASVLAHELSHVSQRHIARLIARQGSDTPWLMGALILGALAARNNADVANAAIVGSQALAVQNQLNFSRDMEREADRVGFGVLTEAGFPGQGFVNMFDKLQQASRLNDDGNFPYLRSHPLTTERIADMRLRLSLEPNAAAPSAAGPLLSSAAHLVSLPLPSADLHALMASRARVLAERGPDRWRAWLKVGGGPTASMGERYAAALSAHQLGQHEVALALGQQLREQANPETRPTLDALMLELMLAAPGGSRQARFADLRDAALASESRAGVLHGALAALASGQPALAATRLQSWVVLHPRDALAWQTLSRAQTALGYRVRALRSEAEAHVAIFDNEGALERLKAAQGLPAETRRADAIEIAIVDARRREVELQLRESAGQK